MLKLQASVSKKVGRPCYGSEGASLALELELDDGLAADAERLHKRARELFALAEAAVDEQLRSEAAKAEESREAERTDSPRPGRVPRRVTARQLRALELLAERQAIDLAELAAERYSAAEPTELSLTQASDLIQTLQERVEPLAEEQAA
ncbi:MAG: hypothetical protein JNK76_24645 [Planctomycetales bacterium]|nr:hypothetical protein [Planctomycetales bacterium]MBN8626599.1 hypothetical protein [Planctomycetota bacterium]